MSESYCKEFRFVLKSGIEIDPALDEGSQIREALSLIFADRAVSVSYLGAAAFTPDHTRITAFNVAVANILEGTSRRLLEKFGEKLAEVKCLEELAVTC